MDTTTKLIIASIIWIIVLILGALPTGSIIYRNKEIKNPILRIFAVIIILHLLIILAWMAGGFIQLFGTIIQWLSSMMLTPLWELLQKLFS
jgi:hypothetical protein